MEYVYLLQHSYEFENGCDEIKILGIYSCYDMARKSIEKYKNLPGFKEYPDGFCIDKYELNKKYWKDGF